MQIAAAAPSNKGRRQRGQRDTKAAPLKEKTPPQDPPHAPTAPRGSPIAKRLAKTAAQPWSALTFPQISVQVSPSSPCLPASHAHAAHTMARGMSSPSLRPLHGKTVSHMRLSLPRAGSPTYYAPRLDAPLSGCEFHNVDTPSPSSLPSTPITDRGLNLSLYVPFYGPCTPQNHKPFPSFSLPSHGTHAHVGEPTLGIAHMSACQKKSYSGPIRLTPEIMVQVVRYICMHPSLDPGEQTTI